MPGTSRCAQCKRTIREGDKVLPFFRWTSNRKVEGMSIHQEDGYVHLHCLASEA